MSSSRVEEDGDISLIGSKTPHFGPKYRYASPDEPTEVKGKIMKQTLIDESSAKVEGN